ncbi:MAG: LysR family transcriptional regulator, partial [Coriobacteriia bacterium]|nr:LysR family transcriptional regulator [Coriobacteriia bacterium]
MNTDNMNLYCIVYEAGGISQASEILFLSHQAVSRRIASIEKEVGATLFERTTRGLAPTKAG